MIRATAIFLALMALPAKADALLQEGAFFAVHRDYHHETNSYTEGAPEGEENACFQITRVDLTAKEIDVVLVSGTYSPWWADGDVFEPGSRDTYIPAIGFMENNPHADWTELLHMIWKTVPNCPEGAS